MLLYGFTSEDQEFCANHGLSTDPTKHRYERHFHDKNELLLFVSGNAEYNIDGEQFVLKPYDLLFIPKTKYHFLVPIDDTPYESYIFTFDMGFSDKCPELFKPPYIINIADKELIKELFVHTSYCYKNYSAEDFRQATINIIRQVLIYLSYVPKNHSSHGERGIVTEIIEYINQHITETLDAEAIARHFSFSKSHVQNKFSTVMGIGLGQYIHHKRMYAADSDIKSGMLPCEAAEKYGYSSYPSFYRQYVKTFGVSPVKRKNK
ncbi:MAG: helix-turn-helix transcriptional regulator [Clostridia bacterium]|nr:helix-turn-helix transcriptional regulator [Clostridia bacterium]